MVIENSTQKRLSNGVIDNILTITKKQASCIFPKQTPRSLAFQHFCLKCLKHLHFNLFVYDIIYDICIWHIKCLIKEKQKSNKQNKKTNVLEPISISFGPSPSCSLLSVALPSTLLATPLFLLALKVAGSSCHFSCSLGVFSVHQAPWCLRCLSTYQSFTAGSLGRRPSVWGQCSEVERKLLSTLRA